MKQIFQQSEFQYIPLGEALQDQEFIDIKTTGQLQIINYTAI